jgi:hypothetical protein
MARNTKRIAHAGTVCMNRLKVLKEEKNWFIPVNIGKERGESKTGEECNMLYVVCNNY